MKEAGRTISPMEKTARELVVQLREHGHIAYFAGGCVRDIVRGQIPKDFDIATDARPEAVQQIFSRTYAVGAHFGVIVVVENGFQFEVATFRSDDVYIDGRRPSAVHFSSPEEDARRRDFTINGMFYDPVTEEVIDFVGGRVDLEARLVRAIGDPGERFKEDRLRMLRAVRFATALDYKIDNQTWDALAANATAISEISKERIREELVRIFTSPNRVRGWDLLDESGLMRAIIPEMEAMKKGFDAARFFRLASRHRQAAHGERRSSRPDSFQCARSNWGGDDRGNHGAAALLARRDRCDSRDGPAAHGFQGCASYARGKIETVHGQTNFRRGARVASG